MTRREYKVVCPLGIHARPATILVKEASNFDANIEIIYKRKKANLKSILGVMALAIKEGDVFHLEVSGKDENLVLERLEIVLKEHALI